MGSNLSVAGAIALLAAAIAISPIVTTILGGIGAASAAVELAVLLAIVALCAILQRGHLYINARAFAFTAALLILAIVSEFPHLLLGEPLPPEAFSDGRRLGTLLILLLIMLVGGLARSSFPKEVVFHGARVACLVILAFSLFQWSRFTGLNLSLLDPRSAELLVPVDEFLGYNLVALYALSTGILALLFRNPLLRFPIIAYSMVLAASFGSRNTLLALALAYAAYTATRLYWSPPNSRFLRFLALTYVAGTCLLLLTAVAPEFWPWLVSKVLQLDDPSRGAGSGFTGRTQIWAAAIDVWQQSPLFGNGFRTFYENPHSGYLQVLGELGLPGLTWFLLLLFWSAKRAFAQGAELEFAAIVAYCVAFASYNVFDSRPTNASNQFTLGFYLLATYALASRGSYAARGAK